MNRPPLNHPIVSSSQRYLYCLYAFFAPPSSYSTAMTQRRPGDAEAIRTSAFHTAHPLGRTREVSHPYRHITILLFTRANHRDVDSILQSTNQRALIYLGSRNLLRYTRCPCGLILMPQNQRTSQRPTTNNFCAIASASMICHIKLFKPGKKLLPTCLD